MLSLSDKYAKYGVQTTFYWSFEDVTATDAPFVGVAPVAADIFISKDGGATAAATNAMTAIGNGVYSHVMTASEMQGSLIVVSVYDQTASEIYKPARREIVTRELMSQLTIDSTAVGGNTPALTLTGVGTGVALNVNGASSSYNHNLFDQSEVAEPSAAPSDIATFKEILQWLKRRWRNVHTASSTQLKVYKDDGTTVLSTQTLTNSSSLQSVGEAS